MKNVMDSFSKVGNSLLDKKKLIGESAKYLENAEEMAIIVDNGLKSENFAELREQLMTVKSSDEGKEKFVFGFPNIVGFSVEIFLCLIISVIFLYFLFIGIFTIIFTNKYFLVALIGISVSILILMINLYLIRRYIYIKKYKNRYTKYCEILDIKSIEIIEELALYSNQQTTVVTSDLQKAINLKLIPQGHFTNDNLVFMVTDKIYDVYLSKPEAYDRYFQKLTEARRRASTRTERETEILKTGERYICKLNGFMPLIKDKTILKKIEKIKNIVSMIFYEIDINPEKSQLLGMFLNYYLPTTEKMIDTYVSVIEKKIEVKDLKITKKEIEEALNIIIVAFEEILGKLYNELEMDIESEVEAMETVMKQEGLIS